MKPLGKLAAAIVGAVLAGGIAQAQGLQDVIEKMGAERCADSSLLCVTIEVPRDHFANDPSKTLPITFAVSPASEQSEGILFYAVGGPGGSGLASAESYIAAFDQDVQSRLDFVFFDQRGTGPDHGLDCPLAQGVFDRSEVTLADEAALLATVQSYVIDCQAELDRTDILPFVGTSQAFRDLELFRQAIGAPKVWLYGESYGTQFMQSYATAFPDAVRGLILDGVVDLNLSAEGFYRTYVQAAERILSRMFSACDADPACAKDMKATSSSVYASLIGQVSAGRSEVDFPLIDGTSARRMLTAGMIESNALPREMPFRCCDRPIPTSTLIPRQKKALPIRPGSGRPILPSTAWIMVMARARPRPTPGAFWTRQGPLNLPPRTCSDHIILNVWSVLIGPVPASPTARNPLSAEITRR